MPALSREDALAAARGADRPLRPRDARAAAARLPDVGGVRARAATRAASGSPTASRRRTATPSTSSCYGPGHFVRIVLASRAARRRALGPGRAVALRPVRAAAVARAAGGRGGGRGSEPRVRHLRPAADRHHRARGERRAPARRTRSPRWRRATWPRARRWTSCCWSRSRGWRPASCATACASGWSRPSASSAHRRRRRRRRRAAARDRPAGGGRACAARGSCARWRTSTRRRSPPRTGSARRCWVGSASRATWSPTPELVEDVERPARRGGRRPLRAPYMKDAGDAGDHARGGDADRARGRSRTRARRSSRATCPATACRRCARGWRRGVAGRARPAQARARRSSPTTTC